MISIRDYAPPSEHCWSLVISGIRNAHESWERSDSTLRLTDGYCQIALGNADRELAQRLIKAGPDHGKFMRQLPVTAIVVAPAYWWREFDTYRVGVTSNSTSQMHTLGKERFAADMFSWEDIDQDTRNDMLERLNWLRDKWINEGGMHKGPDATHWRALLQAIPDSWMYRRCVSLNYQVLRTMYFARRNHRLIEWRRWCEWTMDLPYSELITVEK